MKRRVLYTAVAATVMGTASPIHAAPYQEMYTYYHYENDQIVGVQRDLCTASGVVTQGQWVSGYPTNQVEPVLWIGCEDGDWVPLQ